MLRSSDALEEFLDLLELEFSYFVLKRYMYLIFLRCFNLDNLNIIFLLNIYYKIDARYTRYKMFIVSICEYNIRLNNVTSFAKFVKFNYKL